MGITKTTDDYEDWLRSQTTVVEDEIKTKHKKMTGGEFAFLRATFYHWALLFPKHCADLLTGPRVLGVGDLHIENFGTWRDADGRLAWGVNDFDEACVLPYTNDLIRLATSAYFALADEANPLSLDFSDACQAIQTGYLKRLAEPRPFVLAEDHGWLRDIVIRRLIDNDSSNKEGKGEDDLFKKFHKKYSTLDSIQGHVPAEARAALNACFPQPAPEFEIKYRESGLGSLGRQRFTGVTSSWNGGIIVREAKAVVPSAWLWANEEREASYAEALEAKRIYFSEVVAKSVRAADPWLRIRDRWVVRRLGPDAFKLEIQDLGLKRGAEEELTKKLFEAMGKEIGNIHSPNTNSPRAILDHIAAMSDHHQSAKWIVRGSKAMVEQIQEEFQDWKRHSQ